MCPGFGSVLQISCCITATVQDLYYLDGLDRDLSEVWRGGERFWKCAYSNVGPPSRSAYQSYIYAWFEQDLKNVRSSEILGRG